MCSKTKLQVIGYNNTVYDRYNEFFYYCVVFSIVNFICVIHLILSLNQYSARIVKNKVVRYTDHSLFIKNKYEKINLLVFYSF